MGQADYRWQARPLLSTLIRFAVFLIPIVLAITTALGIAAIFPRPAERVPQIIWWVGFMAATTTALFFFERLARRLMPLSLLLRLSMLFPDKAPSRLVIARKAGRVRDLKEQLEQAHLRAVDDEPTRAAEMILTLLSSLAAHDRGTRGHAERVRVLTDLLGDEMKLRPLDRYHLRWAAILHDIGKLTVPAEILNKSDKLNPQEWDILKRHPLDGVRIAAPLVVWLEGWGAAIQHHHERYDGSGYPHGLKGDEISFGGRIVAVADSYETMTSGRVYKRALSAADGRQELATHAGTQFDPAVVRAFMNISLGKLWRAIGFVSWLVSFPFLTKPVFAAQRVGSRGGSTAASVAAMVAIGLAAAAPLPPDHRPSPAAIVAPRSPSATEVLAEVIDRAEDPPPASALPPRGTRQTSAPPPVQTPVSQVPTTPPDPPPSIEPAPEGDTHGHCVSQTAHSADKGAGKGKQVREVAHSGACK